MFVYVYKSVLGTESVLDAQKIGNHFVYIQTEQRVLPI